MERADARPLTARPGDGGRLRPALAAVLEDLQRPIPLELAIGWPDREGDVAYSGMLRRAEQPDGGATGVPVTRADLADVIVDVDDRLQEQFFPETHGAWGEARAPCPGHAHPAVPWAEDSVAWWTCPAIGERRLLSDR